MERGDGKGGEWVVGSIEGKGGEGIISEREEGGNRKG